VRYEAPFREVKFQHVSLDWVLPSGAERDSACKEERQVGAQTNPMIKPLRSTLTATPVLLTGFFADSATDERPRHRKYPGSGGCSGQLSIRWLRVRVPSASLTEVPVLPGLLSFLDLIARSPVPSSPGGGRIGAVVLSVLPQISVLPGYARAAFSLGFFFAGELLLAPLPFAPLAFPACADQVLFIVLDFW
jgi:hypothetical protein